MGARAWVFFALLILLELIADVLAKEHVLRRHLWLAMVSVTFYALANTAWIISMRAGTLLSVGAALFGVMTALLGILLGVGYYREALSGWQYGGLAVGVVAIILLSMGKAGH